MSAPSPTTLAGPTIAEALHAAVERLREADIEDPRLEAELLLNHALDVRRERLYASLREPLAADAEEAFGALIERRLAHEPAAYITGRREFYGLDFACTSAALIPRPESELLVDAALDRLRELTGATVVDVGTGSGAIAVAIAVHAPETRVVAIDTSRAALALARRNAEAHGVAGRITFVQASLLTALAGRADVIVANLPYVPTAEYRELQPEIRDHEPEPALHADARGTGLIESLLAQARDRFTPDGLLLAEHAWDQGEALRDAARAHYPTTTIETMRDLAGLERVLVIQRNRTG